MAIKVDIEKAYDKLRWDFIRVIFMEIHIPHQMINTVMACISSSQMNILWNGAKSKEYSPSRGIRQGDPLSPYIVILCMDKLSHIIFEVVNNGTWNPMTARRQGPNISHLIFIDDLLLFAEASTMGF